MYIIVFLSYHKWKIILVMKFLNIISKTIGIGMGMGECLGIGIGVGIGGNFGFGTALMWTIPLQENKY